MNLSSDLLRTFVAVADAGSFTRAAEALHRTQSAVSQGVKRLEEEVGRELLARDARGVGLTPAGELLLPYARRILRVQDEAAAVLMRPELSGLVRLAGPDDFAPRFLPGILSKFAEIHPKVQVEVHIGVSRELFARLEQGELDLVIYNCGDVPGAGQVVGRDRLVWAASARHLAHEQDPVPLAVFEHGCIYRRWALQALDAAGRAYRVAYTSPSVTGVLAAVASGLAVAPLSSVSLAPGMRALGPADGFPPLPLVNISLHRRAGPRPAAVESLAEFVAEGIQQGLTDHGTVPQA